MLCESADSLGVGHIATGHHARAEGGRSSWANRRTTRAICSAASLPEQLRRRAAAGRHDKGGDARSGGKMGPARGQPDSMELCFVPDGDYAAWLERRGDAPGRAAHLRGPGRGETRRHTPLHPRPAPGPRLRRGAEGLCLRDTAGDRRGRPRRGAGLFVSEFTAGGYALAGPRAGGALRLRRPHPPLTRARARSRPAPAGRQASLHRGRAPCAPTPARPPRSMSAPRSWEAVSCYMIQRIQIRYIFC